MAVSANALTLGQYAIMSNDPLVLRITYSLLETGSVLSDLPIITKPSLIANGVRWEGNLPSVSWGKLNTDPTVTSGTPTAFQEQAYLIRNAIDVDRFLVMDQNQIQDPRAAQVEALLRSIVYDINDKFINNNHVTGNADAFVGMRYRLDNPTVYGVTSEMKIDAGGVDLSPAGLTATTGNSFIEYVQQVLDFMGAPNGDGVTLYMNDTLKRRFERAVRQLGAGGGWSMVQDAFGRSIEKYRNAIVRDVGRKVNQTTRIITNTETAAGADGASTFTSLYAVRYGEEHCMGWQMDPLTPKNVDMIGNGGTVLRFLIDWAFGLFFQHTRSVARLYDIKVS